MESNRDLRLTLPPERTAPEPAMGTVAPRDRVFLTGATGTVGTGILAALVAAGDFDVTALVRNPRDAARVEQRGVRVVVGDLAEPGGWLAGVSDPGFDFVIHAAQVSYRDHSQAEIDRVERQAVTHLEQIASAETRLMIFTAGVWSYGTGAAGGLIHERTPQQPFSAARDRVHLEQHLLGQRAWPWLVVHPPSLVYGSGGPLQRIAEQLRAGAVIEVLEDERVLWSLVEQEDLGRAYVALLRHGRPGETYVVAEEAAVPVPVFYERVAAAVGAGAIRRLPWPAFAAASAEERLHRGTSQPVDATLIRQRTGWQPRECFAEALPRLVSRG
jgi:nucleoside-diphosphate-sugar epimerase